MLSSLPTELKKVFDHLHLEFSKLQVGRANPALVEGVMVMAYGSPQPLRNLCNVGTIDASTIKIDPWDKSLIKDVEKGISDANLGLNPQNMGDHLLIKVPSPTEERRKELAKTAKKLGEEAKIAVRTVRQDIVKHVDADKALSEDIRKKSKEDLQKEIDAANKKIDEMTTNKEKDVMKI